MAAPRSEPKGFPEVPVLDEPETGKHFNRWAFQPLTHSRFEHLRGRLMSLAESSTRDRQQADAMKLLVIDFLNEAYFPLLRDLEAFCRDMGIISDKEGQCGGPTSRLTAKSLKDVLYEPE